MEARIWERLAQFAETFQVAHPEAQLWEVELASDVEGLRLVRPS